MIVSIPQTIQSLVSGRDAGDTVMEQPVRWKPTAWRRRELEELKGEIDAAESLSLPLAAGWREIRRRHVISLGNNSGLGHRGIFAGALIWGYGPIGYGATRAARMVAAHSRTDLNTRLRGLARAAASGPESAWDAISARDTKIRGLGPAFGTKLTYFLAHSNHPAPAPLPLIADINTSWAIWDLCRVPRSAYSRSNYVKYVAIAHQWAHEIQCPVDEVERALFEYGKGIRRE